MYLIFMFITSSLFGVKIIHTVHTHDICKNVDVIGHFPVYLLIFNFFFCYCNVSILCVCVFVFYWFKLPADNLHLWNDCILPNNPIQTNKMLSVTFNLLILTIFVYLVFVSSSSSQNRALYCFLRVIFFCSVVYCS